MAKKDKSTTKTSRKGLAAKFSELSQRRSFRYGSAATVFTVIIIAAIILVNVLVTSLSARFPLSVDMTSTQRNTLSSKSVTYVKKITSDINIDILADESVYKNSTNYNTALLIMQQFPKYNSHIKINYVNLDNDPTYASKYSKETLSTGDIVVSSGSKYKHISSSDLLVTSTDSSTYSTTVTGIAAEQVIDSAIAYVTATSLPTIVVTSGHNETSSSALTSLLEKNNYQIKTSTIATSGIDQNAKMVIICAPTADFSAGDITKLDTFLKNGGKYGKSVFLVFNPTQTKLPNLESFAKKWGITVGTGVIYGTTSNDHYSSSDFYVLNGDTNSTYVGTLQSGLNAVLSVCRPLTLQASTTDGITTASIVATPSTARLWNPGTITSSTKVNLQPTKDKAGPFDVFAVGTKSATSGSDTVKSNVLVLGSTSFFDSSILSETSLTNSTILVNTVGNVIGFNPGITVESKDLTAQTLTITSGTAVGVIIIFAFLIPIGVLITGLVNWIRRRHQ